MNKIDGLLAIGIFVTLIIAAAGLALPIGADGKDGIDGADGIDGKDGEDGKDCEIDLPPEVIILPREDEIFPYWDTCMDSYPLTGWSILIQVIDDDIEARTQPTMTLDVYYKFHWYDEYDLLYHRAIGNGCYKAEIEESDQPVYWMVEVSDGQNIVWAYYIQPSPF